MVDFVPLPEVLDEPDAADGPLEPLPFDGAAPPLPDSPPDDEPPDDEPPDDEPPDGEPPEVAPPADEPAADEFSADEPPDVLAAASAFDPSPSADAELARESVR
ncbi:MAG TPA: hypothetical protein VH561_22315 [Micromonosporaceae bacterium]